MKSLESSCSLRKGILAYACLALFAVSAPAALYTYYLSYVPNVLPGIDKAGNVNFQDAAGASIKITINTKVPRILAQAQGKVNNFSKRSFKAEDTFVGLSLGSAYVLSDLYTVSPKGAAAFTARVYFQEMLD